MEVSRHWRLQHVRYGLIGEVCGHCDEKIFPPRDVCPNCREEAKTLYQFSGKGEIISLTINHNPAPEFHLHGIRHPLAIALIHLSEGPNITAQLTDVDIKPISETEFAIFNGNNQVQIGDSVEMSTRRLQEDGDRGMLVYGYKFRPILGV